jgi:hypothetical protein
MVRNLLVVLFDILAFFLLLSFSPGGLFIRSAQYVSMHMCTGEHSHVMCRHYAASEYSHVDRMHIFYSYLLIYCVNFFVISLIPVE